MGISDGRHQSHSVKIVRNAHYMGWATDPLRMRYAFWLNGKKTTPAQVIKRNKNLNNSTTIALLKTKLKNIMHSLLRKTRVFLKRHCMRFICGPIMSIVDDMWSLSFLAINYGVTCIHIAKAGKIMIKYSWFLSLHLDKGKAPLAAETLRIMNFDD